MGQGNTEIKINPKWENAPWEMVYTADGETFVVPRKQAEEGKKKPNGYLVFLYPPRFLKEESGLVQVLPFIV